jgi:ATP-dependent RNA helicase DeaD
LLSRPPRGARPGKPSRSPCPWLKLPFGRLPSPNPGFCCKWRADPKFPPAGLPRLVDIVGRAFAVFRTLSPDRLDAMPFPPVNPALERALAAQGYAEPTPVQAAVLEGFTEDRDLLVSAQTGSGKTVAYGLAFAGTLLAGDEKFSWAGPPLALIIAPTRELALQVSRELEWLYKETGARIITCVGGMDAQRERRSLTAGAHIVVGTPGRLRDHVDRGNLDLSALKVVVLDEADEMLDLGFKEDLEAILDVTPPERRTLLFSATIAKEIANLAKSYQNGAVRIDTVNKNEPHGDIEYRAVSVAPNEVENAVVNVLRFFEAGRALVFCSTRESVRHLNAALRERGFAVVALSGELTQKERTDALQALRDGHARVCVATDVAARGLDLPDLGLVVHAELPVNTAALLHRSGRTGRAGRKGISVLLVPYSRRRKAEQLLAGARVDATWGGPPSAAEIRAGDQQRLLTDPILTEAASEEDLPLAKALLESRSAEDIAMALIRFHRSRLPEPEELFDVGGGRATSPLGRERGAPRLDRGSDRDGPREPRPPRIDYSASEDSVWFRLNVGRNANADPKWLIPAICRLGHVTKKDIGQIRIFDNETKFEITNEAQERFSAAVAAHPDDKMKVTPAGAPPARSEGPRGPRPERAQGERPQGDRPAYADRPKAPYARPAYDPAASGEGRPAYKKPYEKKSYDADGAPKAPYARAERSEAVPAAEARPAYKKPYEKKPYDRDAGPKAPYVRAARPDAAAGAEARPPYKKPYEKKPYNKDAGDKAPYVRAEAASSGEPRPAFKKTFDKPATYKGAPGATGPGAAKAGGKPAFKKKSNAKKPNQGWLP